MNDPLKVLVDTVQKLLRRGAHRNLRKILAATRAQDIAGLFRYLSERDRLKLFSEIENIETRAEVLSEVDPELMPGFLAELPDDELVTLLEAMSSDDTVDVMQHIDEERKAVLLRKMTREEMDEAEDLMRYDPDTAGGIMVPDYFALDEGCTCAEAILTLQERHEELEMAFYVYVINEHEHLVGVISLRQLVVTAPETPLKAIMETEVVRVVTTDDQEIVARLVARYNILAIPVVDDSNRLVGIITVDDVIDVFREEATEDMFKMAGAGESVIGEGAGGVFRSARGRLPWLFASWIGGIMASSILFSYSERLGKVAVLAAFIPIILGMGGNVGTQSLTVVTRGLALGRIAGPQVVGVVIREVLVGLTCGVVYGVLLSIAATIFTYITAGSISHDTALFAMTVGISLCAAMVIAATVGATVPILLQKLGFDPAVATGPFVTTSVDLLGIVVYFNVAHLLLNI